MLLNLGLAVTTDHGGWQVKSSGTLRARHGSNWATLLGRRKLCTSEKSAICLWNLHQRCSGGNPERSERHRSVPGEIWGRGGPDALGCKRVADLGSGPLQDGAPPTRGEHQGSWAGDRAIRAKLPRFWVELLSALQETERVLQAAIASRSGAATSNNNE